MRNTFSRWSPYVSVLFVLFFTFCSALDFIEDRYQEEFHNQGRFGPHGFYFAYGDDMLRSEINRVSTHPDLPPVFITPAELKGFRLDFDMNKGLMKGASATVCKTAHNSVWGVVWGLTIDDLKVLKTLKDRGRLMVWYLPVYSPEGKEILVMTFISKKPPKKLPPWIPLPSTRRPSLAYLMAMINGATEARLPYRYVMDLYKIPHSYKSGGEPVRSKLPDPKAKAVGFPDPYDIALNLQINNNK